MSEDEKHPKNESERRFEATLRAALKTPPKPLKDIKPKKKRRKTKASDAS